MSWRRLVAAMLKMQLLIVTATTTTDTLFALNVHEALVADVVATEVVVMAAVAVAMAVVTEVAIQEDTEVVMTEDPAVEEAVLSRAADDLITE